MYKRQDLNNVNLIDSAIKKSELGLNPQIDGQLIRLPVPDLSEERRSEMKKIINIFLILSFVFLSSCKTVQNKADEVIQKEDKYLMKFLNKKKDLLIAEFGYPDLTMPNDGEPPGSGKIIYISKKYGIKCQRSFEIDESDFVVGYSSKGCF